MDELVKAFQEIQAIVERLKIEQVACSCLVGTSFTVTDPWCPEHRVVMDFSGFVSTDLAED